MRGARADVLAHCRLGEPLGPGGLTPQLLADLLESGLGPLEIDRLRLERFCRMRDPRATRPLPRRLVMARQAWIYPPADGA